MNLISDRKFKTLNNVSLKNMLISGANNLFNHSHEIDALNVFPVPDGDTGINMNLTLTSGANEMEGLKENATCHEIAKCFARGLLMGARGNSGVITSQIFKGFSLAIDEKSDIDVPMFKKAMISAYETAYKAVLKPVEGTILTVIRESSQAIKDKDFTSVEKAVTALLNAAKESLKRTPDLLPILKEVGVVDSGGAGLVSIFDGFNRYLTSGEIVLRNEISSLGKKALSAAAQKMANEEFGYCTEFIMSLGPDATKKPFVKDSFAAFLLEKGNSLVVVHDEDIVKVHVHTLTPGIVLNYAQDYGEFLKIKIENMTEQHHELERGAMVTEHEDLVTEVKEKIPYAIIAVSSGEGISDLFKKVGVSYIVKGGQTMNPSSEDFLDAIKEVNANNVFILPNNSNIVMAASQACDMISDDDSSAFVIPSKTIMQGLTAVSSFNSEARAAINFREMKSALKTVKSGEVTFAIRDCELNGVKVHKNDFIGIFEKDIVVSLDKKEDTLMELLKIMVDSSTKKITIFYGEDVKENESALLEKKIKSIYSKLKIIFLSGKQPVYSFLIGVE